jgi:WD40 repeat protein
MLGNGETWEANSPVILSKNPRWQIFQSDLGTVRTSAISPDGKLVVVCGREGFHQATPFHLEIRTAESGKLLKKIDDLGDSIEFLYFSKDGSFFYTIRNKDHKFLSWKSNGEKNREFSVLEGVQAASLSSDSKTLALTGFSLNEKKSILALYDVESGRIIKNLLERSQKELVMSHLKFSKDNKLLYVAIEGKRNGILAIETNSGKEVYYAPQKGWGGKFGIHEEANFLVTYEGEGNRINLFNRKNGSLIKSFPFDTKDTVDLDFHPNGQQVILANRRPKEFLQIINVSNGKVESFAGGMQAFNFSMSPVGDSLSVAGFFSFQLKTNPSYAMYDLGTPESVSQLSSSLGASDFLLGHPVEAQIGGSWMPGFVAQISEKTDQILIEFPSGKPKDKEWVRSSQLRFQNSQDRGKDPMSTWSLGDKIKAKIGGNTYPGKINQINKNTGWILIEFENKQPKPFEWIRPWNLEK